VTANRERELTRLSGRHRLQVVVLALALLTLFGVAGLLHAEACGYGTHQQLGLPPCTFLVLFGVRCPSCGMTTAWSHLAHGHVVAACETHLVGTALGGLDLVAAVWLLLVAWRGRWLGWTPNSTTGAWVATLLAVAMLVEWSVRVLAE